MFIIIYIIERIYYAYKNLLQMYYRYNTIYSNFINIFKVTFIFIEKKKLFVHKQFI